ncbi:MAG TPA: thioredoxin-dependent thiol peroxidase [Candidatus Krumholzibacteria bacterium]|nr:thioredoxin-dependent thiol peroxidase [Candidatus Krumholzibacteria bacterium]
MPKVGTKAPAFTLPNQDGRKIKLSDFQGKTVVLFAYPKAATSGCSVQAKGFRDNLAAITKAGGVVLGISPDPVAKLKKWHDKEAFGYDLLSDEDHAVLEKYGAWGEKSMYGKTYFGVVRSHWVIGPDGKIVDEQIKISPADSIAKGTACALGKE